MPKVLNTEEVYEVSMGETNDIADTLQRFKDYKFRINWNSSEPFDIENDVIDVRIKTKSREEYSANFTTLKFLGYLFEKNKRTGECLSGTYFCMPNMVVVEKLTEDNIRRTIDDLIDRLCIENYFTKLED
jgi:hypothetical protein